MKKLCLDTAYIFSGGAQWNIQFLINIEKLLKENLQKGGSAGNIHKNSQILQNTIYINPKHQVICPKISCLIVTVTYISA